MNTSHRVIVIRRHDCRAEALIEDSIGPYASGQHMRKPHGKKEKYNAPMLSNLFFLNPRPVLLNATASPEEVRFRVPQIIAVVIEER